jgi:O-antigen/teichoic acid export membrane protein
MSVMDAGLTATLSREFAKNDEGGKLDHKMRVLNTLETCYWIIVVVIILIIFVFARPIAEKWITLKVLDISYVSTALKIFGASMALQLLGNFYIGGLIGLERQVKANLYQVIWGVFKNGLVLLVIFFRPSLIYFFAWQGIVTLIYILFLRFSLVKSITSGVLNATKVFLFDKMLLRTIGGFVGGMLLISIVAAINTQLDKIAISKLLPIEELGYYNLGISLTQVLMVLVSPVAMALLPRFTLLYSQKKNAEADHLFYTIMLLVVIFIFSIAASIMFYSRELIFIWTANPVLALSSSKYVLYLALGTAMLATQVIPFNIAIANGYTKINTIMGILSLFISIPGYWISVSYLGPKGAAITWCIIQTITMPLYLYYIHKKFLKEYSYSSLIFNNILFPACSAIAIGFIISLLIPHLQNRIGELALIGLATLLTLIVVTFITMPLGKIRLYYSVVKNRLVSFKR